MALPRYKSNTPNLGRSGVEVAQQAQANSISSFVQGIQGLKTGAVNQLAEESTQRAKQDAEKAFMQDGLQAKVNDDLTVYGKQYTRTLESMHVKKLAIDTSKNMQNIYDNNKDNPLMFNELTSAHYKATAKELPAHLQADYAIDFESNKARFSGQVNANRIRLDKENDFALTNELFNISKQNATQMMRDGNNTGAIYELSKGTKTLDEALYNRTITASQYQKGVDDINYSVSKANFKGVNDGNIERGDLDTAQKYINSFRETTIEGFDDEKRESLADEMQRDLNMEVKCLTATKENNKINSEILVDDAIKVLKKSKMPDNIAEVQIALANVSEKKAHELDVQLKAHKISLSYDGMTLPEQKAALDYRASLPEADRLDVEVESILRKNLKERESKAKKDVMSLSYEEGLNQQQAVLSPSVGLEALRKELPNRVNQQTLNKQQYGEGATNLFTDIEATQYSEWLNSPSTTESDKLDFLLTVEESTRGTSSSVYKQLVKKGANVVAFAGSLLKEGKRDVAKKVIHGQMVLKALNSPEEAGEMRIKILKSLGNATRNMGKDDTGSSLEAILDTGLALYANELEQSGRFDGTASSAQMKKVVKELTNGVHKRNEQSFFLPNDVEDDDFDDWIDELKEDDIGEVAGLTKAQALRIIQDGKINSYGPGRYSIYQGNSNLRNPDGTVFVLKYPK